MNNTQIQNPLANIALPIDLQVKVEPYNAALLSTFLFLAILLALMVFGFVFKR